jgi:rhodanese-related sulfurtransferase
MASVITVQQAHDLLSGRGEIALIDLREPGPFSEGHALFAVPCPFSLLEVEIGPLVPRLSCPVVLMDGGDGLAELAADILVAMGYGAVRIVEGGVPGWVAAGLLLYKGVHVPSKTLGELAELALHPRPISADDLAGWQAEGRDFLFFDTRPAAEHAQMTVPGAVCLPNGELAYRIDSLPAGRPIVLTCAGRTRGIIGAASLSLIAPERAVWWLEDGTQGWRLAGHRLAQDNIVTPLPATDPEAGRARAEGFIEREGLAEITVEDLAQLRADVVRTTFVFDVRDPSESLHDPVACATSAPVVTLVQATDRFIGPRRARVVLVDDTGLRAALAAYWLRALGHEVAICRVTASLRALPRAEPPSAPVPPVATITAPDALVAAQVGRGRFIDLRGSAAYQRESVSGACWSHRAALRDLPMGADPLLIGDDTPRAALAAASLIACGHAGARIVEGGLPALREAGARLGPGRAMDLTEAVDIISFAHGRHDGNADASRLYLSWEKGLVAQLSAAERSQFAI